MAFSDSHTGTRTLSHDGSPAFLSGGGELARLIADFDWSHTALGPVEHWPEAVRTVVGMILRSPQAIVTLWHEPGVMLYNDAYAVFAGARHPQLLGMDVLDAWPEAAELNARVMQTVFHEGGTLEYQDQLLLLKRPGRPDEVWVDLTYSPVPGADGTPLGVVAIVVETTDRVLAEADRSAAQDAIRASEAQFRLFAQAMPNHVWTAPADGVIDWFNKRVAEYTGMADDLLLAGWTEVVHPDDRDAAVVRWQRSLAEGIPYETEFRIRDAAGGFRWHLARAAAIRDDAGRIVRWIGTNTDIHDKKLAEVEMTRERNRVWNLSPIVKIMSDAQSRILAVNPSWTQLLGWSAEETVGRNVQDFIDPEDAKSHVAVRDRLIAGETLTDHERVFLTRTGERRLLAFTIVPEAGTIYAFGRDITAEREAAVALAQTEEALRQSQKMEAVGQLTGGIAHDFNNLLQGITGSLEIVQRRIAQGRTNELDRFITGATTAANRAAALTHRLLAFSRRQPLDPRPVRANPLIASMEDLLRRTLGERVALELVLAAGLWPTLCDPNQLENAVLNLAINARDAMPHGGQLTVETCNSHLDDAYAAQVREVKPGQYICICVTDTGTGMSTGTIAKAFEPFFTTKPIGQGTGLGLSMIYGFARQSEGYVKIYSEEGQGTTVKLYLPRFRGMVEGEEEMPRLGDAHATDQGEVVLVVEDEPVVRGLIVETLTELGYQALEAADGPKGVELLQSRRRIDLLVTDIGLPGLNGRQVADAGRSLRPGLKVLFMTGYAENAALASGFLEPGMSMITKPFAMEALATRIRAIVEGEG